MWVTGENNAYNSQFLELVTRGQCSEVLRLLLLGVVADTDNGRFNVDVDGTSVGDAS